MFLEGPSYKALCARSFIGMGFFFLANSELSVAKCCCKATLILNRTKMKESEIKAYLDKQFASVGVSKLAIELGFKKPCLPWNGSHYRPLWQQIIDWLREDHNIIVEPSYDFAETQTYNVALIQEGDSPVYHATDILEEKDYYEARRRGVEQALQMVKDGTMDYLQFEAWFTSVLELWAEAGLYNRIAIDKDNARLHYDLGTTPEQYVNQAKEEFK
jgi:hypothetical protein